MNMAPKGRIPAIRILEERRHTFRLHSHCVKDVIVVKHLPYKLVHVPALLWHLPRDLVGAHRVIVRLFAEAKVVSQVDQGHGDTEPHAQQGQHGGEGDLK